jgi:NAD(P)H-dependent flavin oxidoreductase YrpB (nitropropane dioxygenase family)
LKRPMFFAVVTSPVLATNLARKASGRVDGFVVEGPTAGGHNAPPRGAMQLSDVGEPIYGARDQVDFSKFVELGQPFWLAGGWGRPGRLAEAKAHGANGIQVGTAFAFCRESGLATEYKHAILRGVRAGNVKVFTDPVASPTGFPFKVVTIPGTLADPAVYQARPRLCDIGMLRSAFTAPDGGVAWRCPAEPLADYLRKGGAEEETGQKQCLCNGLFAAIGLGQTRPDGFTEPPILTAGDDLVELGAYLPESGEDYPADSVLDKLLA